VKAGVACLVEQKGACHVAEPDGGYYGEYEKLQVC
jgi:hypothetical protein